MKVIDGDHLKDWIITRGLEDPNLNVHDILNQIDREIEYPFTLLKSLLKLESWVPCSKKLPDEYGNYLITTSGGDVDVATYYPKATKLEKWWMFDVRGAYVPKWRGLEIVAWMPLPGAYVGGGEE